MVCTALVGVYAILMPTYFEDSRKNLSNSLNLLDVLRTFKRKCILSSRLSQVHRLHHFLITTQQQHAAYRQFFR